MTVLLHLREQRQNLGSTVVLTKCTVLKVKISVIMNSPLALFLIVHSIFRTEHICKTLIIQVKSANTLAFLWLFYLLLVIIQRSEVDNLPTLKCRNAFCYFYVLLHMCTCNPEDFWKLDALVWFKEGNSAQLQSSYQVWMLQKNRWETSAVL